MKNNKYITQSDTELNSISSPYTNTVHSNGLIQAHQKCVDKLVIWSKTSYAIKMMRFCKYFHARL